MICIKPVKTKNMRLLFQSISRKQLLNGVIILITDTTYGLNTMTEKLAVGQKKLLQIL